MKKENYDILFKLYEEKMNELERLQKEDQEKGEKTERKELLDQIQVLYNVYLNELDAYNMRMRRIRKTEWIRHIQKQFDNVFGPGLIWINPDGIIMTSALPKNISE